ncbi:MAG: hypothetical protein HOE90_01805 [Bacteriovoracaceae bacterium]|jgi:hypothetical protein|nr:hypothetical protein [Bacteriovoracaceae bacterium]
MDIGTVIILLGLGLTVAVMATPIILFNRRQQKKLFEKYEKMSPEQRQLEVGRLQASMGNKKTSHFLHFFITFFTFGFWIIPWVLISHNNTVERRRIDNMLNTIVESASDKAA